MKYSTNTKVTIMTLIVWAVALCIILLIIHSIQGCSSATTDGTMPVHGVYVITSGTRHVISSSGGTNDDYTQDLTGAMFTVSQDGSVIDILGCLGVLEESGSSVVLKCSASDSHGLDMGYAYHNTASGRVVFTDNMTVSMKLQLNGGYDDPDVDSNWTMDFDVEAQFITVSSEPNG